MLWFMLYLCLVSVNSQGPQEVEFGLTFTGHPYSCDGSMDWCDLSGVKPSWINETTVGMAGVWNLKQTLEPCTMITVIVNKEANGKSETVMTLEICDFCKEIGNADSNYYKYLKFILLPEKCPMDPGLYTVQDLLVDSAELPINSANSGEYTIYMYFHKLGDDCDCKGDKTYLACIQFDCAIEPVN